MSDEINPVGYMVANHPDGPWSFRKKEGLGWFCVRAIYSEDQLRQLSEQRAALLEHGSALCRALDEGEDARQHFLALQSTISAIALAQGDAA